MSTICDRCSKYEVSMCGTREICHAKKDNSRFIIRMDDHYIEQRMIGEKKHCKEFKKI